MRDEGQVVVRKEEEEKDTQGEVWMDVELTLVELSKHPQLLNTWEGWENLSPSKIATLFM